jgi:hypothetical protein
MKKTIRLTESDLVKLVNRVISEQALPLPQLGSIAKNTVKVIVGSSVSKFNNFKDKVRPLILDKMKEIYPAIMMAKQTPSFKNTPEYHDLKEKGDAYRHQVASAVLTTLFGPTFADILGKAHEIKGGWEMFKLGDETKGIGKYQSIDSGWSQDNANNNIGIKMAQQYPGKDWKFYSNLAVRNINSKNYYDTEGNKKK